MPKQLPEIKLKALDDIFSSQAERDDEKLERVQILNLEDLHPFPNHPFHVLDDDKMQETVESIRKNGILLPGIARPRPDGGFEIVAGHRRAHACALAQLDTMPFIVREMDDDTATIIMVDSNVQRENVLPSEKAFSYKMKLDAMKRQGKRVDLTCGQVGHKLDGKKSVMLVADDSGESYKQIQRYIRLTSLIPQIMQIVDDDAIAMNAAVELSYLPHEEQEMVNELILRDEAVPSIGQAKKIRQMSGDGKLSEPVLEMIMVNNEDFKVKITLSEDRLKKYFPPTYTAKQMDAVITDLLTKWHKRELEKTREKQEK